MFKLPFRTPYKQTVTQEYGNKSNNTWYIANGITAPFHNGWDITCGNPKETFGTPCVSPFNGFVAKVTFDTPDSTKGNGVTIQSDPIDGIIYKIVFWHTSEVKLKAADRVKEGDILCYIGNSGAVFPEPTLSCPFCGSHCHLM